MSKYIIEIAEEYEEYFKGVLICGIADGKFAVDVIAREDLEELNSDYINEHYGQLQDEAYQRGHDDGYEAGCATAFKPVSDAEYQRGYDEGYKKCLSENDFDQPCVSCDDYQRGLNDAWEAAKKIMNMSDPPYWDVFGEYKNELFKKFSVSEAIAKLKAYEGNKDEPIKAGDIVERYIDGKLDSKGIYLQETGGYWRCLFDTGAVLMTFAYPKGQFKKTGKHYDIASILEAMRE